MVGDGSEIKYSTKLVDGEKVLYGSWWIRELESEMHFNWYYHQARAVYCTCTREMYLLEIGVGTNLLSDLLKRRGWKVDTLDIDPDKNPDICDSAYDFNYKSSNYNVVLAFEIFEHMPYKTFLKTIEKISNSSVDRIIFSVPWNELSLFRLELKIPLVSKLSINPTISRRKISTRAHFWELSKKNRSVDGKELVSLASLRQAFESCGLKLEQLQKVGYIQYFQAIH